MNGRGGPVHFTAVYPDLIATLQPRRTEQPMTTDEPLDPTLTGLGTTIADRYVITGQVGTFGDGSPCDHPSASRIGDRCRCIVCTRCGRHTGNSHQGHYWAYCHATKTTRDFHLCCPGNCELEAQP